MARYTGLLDSTTTESKSRRIPSKEKTKAVLRLLTGEDISDLAEELGASPERLARWRQKFVEAGDAALARKKPAFQSKLWNQRKGVLQWAGVIVVLILMVFFLTRFFESGGGAAAP